MIEPDGRPDPQLLLTALSTEHFTLATARATTVGESNARATMYLFTVSGALVAIGFVGQLSTTADQLFRVFTLTLLPTLLALGLLTFLRLTELGVEDFRYGQAINRVRQYYLQVAGSQRGYFLLSGHDDIAGVWSNMGLSTPPSRLHGYYTMPVAIGFVNSMIAASTLAFVVGIAFQASLGPAVAAGAATAVTSLLLQHRYNERCFQRAFLREPAEQPLFPSPGAARSGSR